MDGWPELSLLQKEVEVGAAICRNSTCYFLRLHANLYSTFDVGVPHSEKRGMCGIGRWVSDSTSPKLADDYHLYSRQMQHLYSSRSVIMQEDAWAVFNAIWTKVTLDCSTRMLFQRGANRESSLPGWLDGWEEAVRVLLHCGAEHSVSSDVTARRSIRTRFQCELNN